MGIANKKLLKYPIALKLLSAQKQTPGEAGRSRAPRGPLLFVFLPSKVLHSSRPSLWLQEQRLTLPRSLFVRALDRHSLGTYYELTAIGTRVTGVSKTDPSPALHGDSLEGRISK